MPTDSGELRRERAFFPFGVLWFNRKYCMSVESPLSIPLKEKLNPRYKIGPGPVASDL